MFTEQQAKYNSCAASPESRERGCRNGGKRKNNRETETRGPDGCRSAEFSFEKVSHPPLGFEGTWEFRYPQGCGINCTGNQYAPTEILVLGSQVAGGLYSKNMSPRWPPCGTGVECNGELLIEFKVYGSYGNCVWIQWFAGWNGSGGKIINYAVYPYYGSYTVDPC